MQTQVTTLKLTQLILSQTPLQKERRRYRTDEDIRSIADTMQSVGQLMLSAIAKTPRLRQ